MADICAQRKYLLGKSRFGFCTHARHERAICVGGQAGAAHVQFGAAKLPRSSPKGELPWSSWRVVTVVLTPTVVRMATLRLYSGQARCPACPEPAEGA